MKTLFYTQTMKQYVLNSPGEAVQVEMLQLTSTWSQFLNHAQEFIPLFSIQLEWSMLS